MPAPGKAWRHVIFGTYASWLPGDPRGFRTRHHKLHSGGAYRSPPPAGEHADVLQHSQKASASTVTIPASVRGVAGRAIVKRLIQRGHRILAISVSGQHVHLLAELPDDMTSMRKIVGECKNTSSHALRSVLPGRVWAAGGKFKCIADAAHQRRTFQYILHHVHEHAWVWSFRQGLPTLTE